MGQNNLLMGLPYLSLVSSQYPFTFLETVTCSILGTCPQELLPLSWMVDPSIFLPRWKAKRSNSKRVLLSEGIVDYAYTVHQWLWTCMYPCAFKTHPNTRILVVLLNTLKIIHKYSTVCITHLVCCPLNITVCWPTTFTWLSRFIFFKENPLMWVFVYFILFCLDSGYPLSKLCPTFTMWLHLI